MIRCNLKNIFAFFAILIVLFQGCSNSNENKISTDYGNHSNYGFLYDKANILKNEQKADITKIISEHNSKGPGRISVIIYDELPNNISIERCAFDLINAVPSTENEKKDRVLLLIAIKHRVMRIETSEDVWGLLKNSHCKNIINDVMAPEVKKEQYYSGLVAGLFAMTAKLKS